MTHIQEDQWIKRGMCVGCTILLMRVVEMDTYTTTRRDEGVVVVVVTYSVCEQLINKALSANASLFTCSQFVNMKS